MRRPFYHKPIYHRQQSGAALLVSLMLLLTMTIIALSSLNSSIMDEKIVGNQRDKSFSRVMADAVLREPEVWLQGQAQRLTLEANLCDDDTAQCTSSDLWLRDTLNWSEWTNGADGVTDWWGDPSQDNWADNSLAIAYGTNGTDTYCAGMLNEKQYDSVPPSVNDGNNDNNCLANVVVPPTYIVEQYVSINNPDVQDLGAKYGGESTCAYKINNYYYQTTVQSSGARDTTNSMVRGTYVKKC